MVNNNEFFYFYRLSKFLFRFPFGSGTGGGIKAAWSEEQEEELRRLYMENQENPESDQGKKSFVWFYRVKKWRQVQELQRKS